MKYVKVEMYVAVLNDGDDIKRQVESVLSNNDLIPTVTNLEVIEIDDEEYEDCPLNLNSTTDEEIAQWYTYYKNRG